MSDIEQTLVILYQSWCGDAPVSVTKLPGSGSGRIYFRLTGPGGSVIGAHNEDIRENEAFIAFTHHFHAAGLPVPRILAGDAGKRDYLIADLGDTTLFQLLTEARVATAGDPSTIRHEGSGRSLPGQIMKIYKKALDWLPLFQVTAGRKLDYAVCYPRASFDRQSMMWDLNYFKYYFLKLANIPFDEQALENDFSGVCDLLLEADDGFFLYRDFQSRNIMVLNGEPWFIDYQGGRRGALQYDIASLLFDGKADIAMADRDELLDHYLDKLEEIYPVDREKFMKYYHGFVLIRILQALGAYGFRGYYEKKPHFLKSIPFALGNLRYLRKNNLAGFGLPTLMSVIDRMVDQTSSEYQLLVKIIDHNNNNDNDISIKKYSDISAQRLTVTIYSFSYRTSLPVDETGNGGGFVFDCRALPNPGRFDAFRELNGKDRPVIDFLNSEPAVREFLGNVYRLIGQSVQNYIDRRFENLMVSFGCTGGRHRSVYCAEELARHLNAEYGLKVKLIHSEQNGS